jgi:cardiolipin synthase
MHLRRRPWLAVAALLLATALAAGCGALPKIHPDLALPREAPRIEGARGPLSAAKSRAILDRLAQGDAQSDNLARHLAIEEALADTPLVAGNAVTLLRDGPATYRAMFDAIRGARDHINLETYIVEDDEVGQRFADALIERQRAGVQVNVIYDGVGSLGTDKRYFERLRAAGIALVEYNPVNPLAARAGWDVNGRDHRKQLIVDGRSVILGGINISSVYSSASAAGSGQPRDGSGDDNEKLPWRDTDLRIEGPVVADFQKLFMQTWAQQHGAPLAERRYFPPLAARGKAVVRALGGSPDEPYSRIYATLISAIENAATEVLITNAYFAPDPQLRAALKAAAARGVEVRLLLPSKTDSSLILWAGHAYYAELLEGGVKINERREALLHSKTALIDGVWSTVGSTNLDWRSFLHNQEINAVVLGADFGAQMRAMFEADLAASDAITLEAWQRRPLAERLEEAFARLWQYWL